MQFTSLYNLILQQILKFGYYRSTRLRDQRVPNEQTDGRKDIFSRQLFLRSECLKTFFRIFRIIFQKS